MASALIKFLFPLLPAAWMVCWVLLPDHWVLLGALFYSFASSWSCCHSGLSGTARTQAVVLTNVGCGSGAISTPVGPHSAPGLPVGNMSSRSASGIEINVAYSRGEPLQTGLLGTVVQVVHCTSMPGWEEALCSAFQAEHAGVDCVCLQKGAYFSLHKLVILSPGSVHSEGISVCKLQSGTLLISSSQTEPWTSAKPAAPPRAHSEGHSMLPLWAAPLRPPSPSPCLASQF